MPLSPWEDPQDVYEKVETSYLNGAAKGGHLRWGFFVVFFWSKVLVEGVDVNMEEFWDTVRGVWPLVVYM